MDVRDAFALGIEIQVRRVISRMGEERVIRGLDAFETGRMGDWGTCFFAQAYPEVDFFSVGNPEKWLMKELDLPSTVPIRIVYTLFDGVGHGRTITRNQLAEMMRMFLDEQRPAGTSDAIKELIKSTNFERAQDENDVATTVDKWLTVCSPKNTIGA